MLCCFLLYQYIKHMTLLLCSESYINIYGLNVIGIQTALSTLYSCHFFDTFLVFISWSNMTYHPMQFVRRIHLKLKSNKYHLSEHLQNLIDKFQKESIYCVYPAMFKCAQQHQSCLTGAKEKGQ